MTDGALAVTWIAVIVIGFCYLFGIPTRWFQKLCRIYFEEKRSHLRKMLDEGTKGE